MRRPRGTLRLAGLLAGCLALGALPGGSATARDRLPDDYVIENQTSDNVPGEVARQLPEIAPVIADDTTREIAPGLTLRQWDQTDERGRIRAWLLAGSLDEPTLKLRYVGAPYIRNRVTLTRMLKLRGAIAGVNGDFFDIEDLGAPFGVGVDRGTLLHGNLRQNAAFMVDAAGQPQLTHADVETAVRGRPEVVITNVNSPRVDKDGIGIYTPRWGRTAGYRVVESEAEKVREVVVRRHKVVSNKMRLSGGEEIRGFVLVGRGRGARRLRDLEERAKVAVVKRVVGAPRLVVTSNAMLVRDGERVVRDDREMHPRTAVGIDTDGRRILMLVVDGRQSHSRGLTMVELADLMLELGAEQALNLDGGGSSTMVARDPTTLLPRVWNSPSDGKQRRIPNGLGWISTAP